MSMMSWFWSLLLGKEYQIHVVENTKEDVRKFIRNELVELLGEVGKRTNFIWNSSIEEANASNCDLLILYEESDTHSRATENILNFEENALYPVVLLSLYRSSVSNRSSPPEVAHDTPSVKHFHLFYWAGQFNDDSDTVSQLDRLYEFLTEILI